VVPDGSQAQVSQVCEFKWDPGAIRGQLRCLALAKLGFAANARPELRRLTRNWW